jgi:hypothetical protein
VHNPKLKVFKLANNLFYQSNFKGFPMRDFTYREAILVLIVVFFIVLPILNFIEGM